MKIKRRPNVDPSPLEHIVGDPILRQLLANRGVSSEDELNCSINHLLKPELKDIEKAAELIAEAVWQRKKVLIAGDYDVDGMTGTALGVRCLEAFGMPPECISYYVPSRYGHGYGLNPEIVAQAKENNIELIVTVDNGIAAYEAVDEAKRLGIKVVITDHHEVQDNRLPDADAVVNPKRPDDTFGSKHLCGVGVLFYVLCVTRTLLVNRGYYPSREAAPAMNQFLDLVSIGTIGDVMTLDANNRRLVRAGLKRIHDGLASTGIKALLQYLKIQPEKITTRNLAFDLCPRFNAATRIKLDTNPAIDLLLCKAPEQALALARQLDQCNRRRMDHEKIMTARAQELYQAQLAAHAQLGQAQQAAASAADAATTTTSSEATPAATDTPAAPEAATSVFNVVPISEVQKDNLPEETDSSALLKAAREQDAGVVLFDPCFMSGLVGLVANRSKEKLQRPCMIFGADVGVGRTGGAQVMLGLQNAEEAYRHIAAGTTGDMELSLRYNAFPEALAAELRELSGDTPITGSARSIDGIDLMEVFAYIKSEEPNIFLAGGGHSAAAGATICLKDLERFRELFSEGCRRAKHQGEELDARITDGELPDSHLCLAFASDIESLGPWGKNYEEPVFDGVFYLDQITIIKNHHLKMRLRTANNRVVNAIKFRASVQEKSLVKDLRVQVLYKLSIDRYLGQEYLQLMVDRIEPI